MHVARQDDVHACGRKRFRSLFVVVREVFAEDVRLHAKVRDQAVVFHADHNVAARIGFRSLFRDPLEQVFAERAARHVLIRAAVGDVRAVFAGVHDDKGEALRWARHIGEAALLLPFRRGVGCNGVRVGDVMVNFLELFRGGLEVRVHGAGGRRAIGILHTGGKVGCIGIVDVVVAVDDIDLHVRVGGPEFGEHRGHLAVGRFLAVLGQVAADDQHVRVGLVNHLKDAGVDVLALRHHLAVGVQGRGEIRVFERLGVHQVAVPVQCGLELARLLCFAAVRLHGFRQQVGVGNLHDLEGGRGLRLRRGALRRAEDAGRRCRGNFHLDVLGAEVRLLFRKCREGCRVVRQVVTGAAEGFGERSEVLRRIDDAGRRFFRGWLRLCKRCCRRSDHGYRQEQRKGSLVPFPVALHHFFLQFCNHLSSLGTFDMERRVSSHAFPKSIGIHR